MAWLDKGMVQVGRNVSIIGAQEGAVENWMNLSVVKKFEHHIVYFFDNQERTHKFRRQVIYANLKF